MRIGNKQSHSPAFLQHFLSFFLRKKRLILLSFFLITFAALGVAWKKNWIEKITRNIPYLIQGFWAEPPEQLTIDLKFENFQKLTAKRSEALKSGFLISTSDDYVPAVLSHHGKKYDIDLRLKGDFAHEHLSGDKWSFRIEVKKGKTLFGMRRFSLHAPKARWYLSEWVFHKVLKHEDVIAMRYDFVNVTLNGKNLGLYALEEHLGKLLLEDNKFREGIILHFDDDLFLKNRIHHGETTLISGYNNIGYNATEVTAYELGRIQKDPGLFNQFKTAIELIGRLRTGELELNQVFDLRRMAKFYAACDLLGAVHNTLWPNFLMYYNPINGKLEPIAFDAEDALHGVVELAPNRFMHGDQERTSSFWITQPIYRLWEDKEFMRLYLGELERLSAPGYVDKIIHDIGPEMKEKIGHLWTLGIEGAQSQSFKFVQSRLHDNAEILRKKLNVVKGVHAYFLEFKNNTVYLNLGNTETLPMEIEKITFQGRDAGIPEKEIYILPRRVDHPINFSRYAFTIPSGFSWDDKLIPEMQLHYRVPGTSIQRTANITPWGFLDDRFLENDFMRSKPNIEKFAFIMPDPSSRTLAIAPGIWEIHENLIIPAGWTVAARGATTLNLKNNAKILSYSAFHWVGTPEAPITLESTDGTGQGLFILNSKNTSVFQNVIFKNLSNPAYGWWALTGSVNFYETDVVLSYCQFLSNRSEDNLNIIRSSFLIEDTIFKDSLRDALDFDFSKGELKRVRFLNSGNDSLDFSGSHATATDVRINDTGDKGISIGEASTISLSDVQVNSATTAVAVKDGSRANIQNLSISNTALGFALYQKKPEYPDGSLSVIHLKLDLTERTSLVQKGYHLDIDGEPVQASSSKEIKQFLTKTYGEQ